MNYERILEKRETILQYCHRLTEMHRAALFDEEESPRNLSLQQLRKNIHICLKDLCRLNTWLTEQDGGFRKALGSLERYESKLSVLLAKERQLGEERRAWEATVPAGAGDDSGGVFTIHGGHQLHLNAYVESIGVDNTSLGKDADAVPKLSRQQALRHVAVLRQAQAAVSREISQAEGLLKSFRKDQTFIKAELSKLEAFVRAQKLAVERELESVRRSQEHIFRKIGLLKLPARDREPLGLGGRPVADLESIKAQMDDFLHARRGSLKAMLSEHKQETQLLKSQQEAWKEVTTLVEDLEERIRTRFATAAKVDPIELRRLITDAIAQIKSLHYEDSYPDVLTCIQDEIAALDKANDQLPFSKQKSVTDKLVPVNTGAGFLVNGTSPPKVGLTKSIVPSSSMATNKKSV
ncbi:AaceriAER116Cp [[Ashbya] aceris (nom. inval.)]|nr:AaceriAER116Cp [[Ashbya] aceris (nom. inval.)]